MSVSKYIYDNNKNNIHVISLNPSIFTESNILNKIKIINKNTISNTNPSLFYLLYLLTKIPLYFILLNKVKDKASPFKPEYVFPQMFTNYVRRNLKIRNVFGIEYPSTKITDDSLSFFNYTFFSYPNRIKGCEYCDFLTSSFSLTEGIPLVFSYINKTKQNISYNPMYKSIPVFLSKDVNIEYQSTIFFRHESLLNNVPTDKLP